MSGWSKGGRLANASHGMAMRRRARGRSADLLQLLMDNIPDTIYFKDTASRFTRINRAQARVLGVADPADAIGKSDFDFQWEHIARASFEQEQEIMATGRPLIDSVEFNPTPSGEARWFSNTKAPIRDQAGQVTGLVGISRDVTEQQQAQAALQAMRDSLEATNRELEAFSYSVSHDLRAPLRALDGFSLVLLEDYSDNIDAQGRDYLKRVRAASNKMGELIDALLALARVTRAPLRHETVDLTAQAEVSAAELRAAEPARQVETIIAPGLTATGDPRLLHGVVENLLANAWKFTSKAAAARIEVGAAPSAEPGQEVVFFVRDNGAGFDMAHADKLFGAFQRLHAQTEFSGMGIGLASVQRIVARHGGRVWAESQPGQGATFFFALPAQ